LEEHSEALDMEAEIDEDGGVEKPKKE